VWKRYFKSFLKSGFPSFDRARVLKQFYKASVHYQSYKRASVFKLKFEIATEALQYFCTKGLAEKLGANLPQARFEPV
jgi:hypothetical protein